MNELTKADDFSVSQPEGLPDSAPLLDEPEKLRKRWEDDGVLYFRDVIDKGAIAKVRNTYLDRLKEVGMVDEDASQPIWTGRDRLDGKLAKPVSDSVWRDLVSHPSFDGLVQRFLGEAPAWVPIVVHRAAPPLDPAKLGPIYQGRHQDGVFNYGVDFITCWVPLMDIDPHVGGLAVVPGSHKASLYADPEVHKSTAQRGMIPDGRIPNGAWRRPDYRAGDLLVFHSMTAHAGLPNTSDRLRLSIDVRFLRSSAPKPIVGVVEALDGGTVHMHAESGEALQLALDDKTIVRGPKGSPVTGQDISSVIFPGASIIAVPNEGGAAKLIRSVSRKYLDLPPSLFVELPTNWVH